MRSCHSTLLSGIMRQVVHRATVHEGGVSYPRGLLHKDQATGCRRPLKKNPNMCVPPVEKPTCAAFEEYKEVPETALIDLSKYDITWVTSKLSGASGALGSEAIQLRNWILCFGCALEEFRVVVANLADCMATPPPPS